MTMTRQIKPKLPVRRGIPHFTTNHLVSLYGDDRQRVADVSMIFSDFVETAINMHDELVVTLELAVANLQGLSYESGVPSAAIIKSALALIAKAKGTEPP